MTNFSFIKRKAHLPPWKLSPGNKKTWFFSGMKTKPFTIITVICSNMCYSPLFARIYPFGLEETFNLFHKQHLSDNQISWRKFRGRAPNRGQAIPWQWLIMEDLFKSTNHSSIVCIEELCKDCIGLVWYWGTK